MPTLNFPRKSFFFPRPRSSELAGSALGSAVLSRHRDNRGDSSPGRTDPERTQTLMPTSVVLNVVKSGFDSDALVRTQRSTWCMSGIPRPTATKGVCKCPAGARLQSALGCSQSTADIMGHSSRSRCSDSCDEPILRLTSRLWVADVAVLTRNRQSRVVRPCRRLPQVRPLPRLSDGRAALLLPSSCRSKTWTS